MPRIEAFLRLADEAVAVQDSDVSWETKYDLLFSSEISGAISKTGVEISYVDPDGSYEEDVRAFIDAVEKKATDLKKAFAAITTV